MAPNFNFVDVPDLNKVLRSEVFMSEDKQLRAVHLILNFKPLSDKFQDVGNAIRAGDPRLARIDVLVLGFLTGEDIVQVELPSHHSPHEVVALREETASSRLSLEAKIDQFYLEEGLEQREPVIQVSDSEDERDRSSSIRALEFIIACVANSLEEEEEEEMLQDRKKGLCKLLANKAKGSVPKDASRPKRPPFSPLPPTVNPFMPANLKKRKKDKEVVEKGELIPHNEKVPPMLQKTKGPGKAND